MRPFPRMPIIIGIIPLSGRTNLTLRVAFAPTYLDSELGIAHAISENTDLGIGVAGGGFADNYSEVRQGTYRINESFTGYGGETSLSLYHLFNPGHMIPLNGVLRGIVHYSTYERDDRTAKDFQLPDDRTSFYVRTGLRWGGREPTLFPSLAMELSIWYEGVFRDNSGTYGFNDRKVEPHSHLFWGEALLAYTMPELKHRFFLSLTAATSVDADRFSGYRLGSFLPLVAEYPLTLPGYYYQEISSRQFVLLAGEYILPLDKTERWNVIATAASGVVDYLPGLQQPGNWHSGVGGGVLYKSPSWKIMLNYAYGVDAIRTHGRGANSVGVLLQFDLGQARETMLNSEDPNRWRGIERIFGLFGN